MALTSWLNTAWMWKCQPELSAFHRATRSVAQTQADVLQAMVAANRDTWFGRRFDFSGIASAADFQKRVPLSTSDDYQSAVERIANGEPGVLTRERPRLLQPTSGSSGAEKLIPYTATLQRQFQRGVATWIADLFQNRPAVRMGRAYWSISPQLGARRISNGGVPIGFDDDAAYLGTLERFALARLLVAPSAIARVTDITAFRYCTLLKLLQAEDLSLISVWSPTFLSSLLSSLECCLEQIIDDIDRGSLRGAAALPAELTLALTAGGRPMPNRAQRLREIFKQSAPLHRKFAEVWPRLALVSCWADATAALPLNELRSYFPTVEIQPKGLLATEGFVSLPLCDQPAPALALRSHFFEFIPSSPAPLTAKEPLPAVLAHELDRGATYQVVLTTAGGLYRYPLHDEVEVVGFLNECPLLRFLGRANRTSDLVGEKLNEPHVRAVLEQAFRSQQIAPVFALVAPVTGSPTYYRLYVQLPQHTRKIDSGQLRSQVECGLSENPHYRYALGLGQLGPLAVCELDPFAECAWRVVERRMIELGQRVGDIKPIAMGVGTHWPALLAELEVPQQNTRNDSPSVPRTIPRAAH